MTNNVENKLQNEIAQVLGIEPEEQEPEDVEMPEGAVDDDGVPIDGQEDDGVYR